MTQSQYNYNTFPKQNISYKAKNKKWRTECVLWAAHRSYESYNPIRATMTNKVINYDLVSGILHMEDIKTDFNPFNLEYREMPDKIQHYPIMNGNLDTLIGELTGRPFDYRVVITNPNAISEIEESKKEAIYQSIQQLVESKSSSEDEFNANLEKMGEYFTYDYQDFREVRGNQILNHYSKEYNIPLICTNGFKDALIVGEEIYHCGIVGGEPTFERVNNCKLSVFSSGYSNKIEDADILIYEDYLSPSQIIDKYCDVLTEKDVEFIENGCKGESSHPADNYGLVLPQDALRYGQYKADDFFGPDSTGRIELSPFDMAGNIRVMTVYWKSKRKILKVKKYDIESGTEYYELYPETYKPNEALGEEIVKVMWVNQAWEGTLIGSNNIDDDNKKEKRQGIVINVRPCPVQYNSLSNPSRCHFGYVGTIYNLNDDRPYSLVDRMKPLAYMYDILMYYLLETISANFGAILSIDMDTLPDGWDIPRWLYYAKNYHVVPKSPAKMGTGEAAGKFLGALPGSGNQVLAAPVGDYITQLVNLIDWIKKTMSDMVGITEQRKGAVGTRETKGGIERSVLQSSYITEWLFKMHEDTVKRALECFLETAKIALKGRNVKFNYITSDQAMRVMDIDGDEFNECDYGLVVEQTQNTAIINDSLNQLAQIAVQNNTLTLSSYMKTMFATLSLAEKSRIIEHAEQKAIERQEQQQQQQMQMQQEQIQADAEQSERELQAKIDMNRQDNDTKILVAQIQAEARMEQAAYTANSFQGISGNEVPDSMNLEREKIEENIRQFEKKYKLEEEKLKLEKQKAKSKK
ncbi:MAG: hypothetical protein IJ180_11320 [Bacteroidales bacterium]|nr:hypothetical protein [Bacteroidales bacterium]MBQ9255346.1 hypothetical protein [Bacteroidales bacterium]